MYITAVGGVIIEHGQPGPIVDGTSSSAERRDFEQMFSVPLNCWTVNHNLGRYPLTLILSPGGRELDAEITHVNLNQLQVSFSAHTAGRIRCT